MNNTSGMFSLFFDSDAVADATQTALYWTYRPYIAYPCIPAYTTAIPVPAAGLADKRTLVSLNGLYVSSLMFSTWIASDDVLVSGAEPFCSVLVRERHFICHRPRECTQIPSQGHCHSTYSISFTSRA